MLALSFEVGHMVYYSRLTEGFRRFDRDILLDLGLWISISGNFGALYAFVYMFYLQLVPMRVYGRLFGLSSLILKRPRLVKKLTWTRIIGTTVVSFILVVMIPRIVPYSLETVDIVDTVIIAFMAFLCLDFCMVTLWLLLVLRKLFKELENLSVHALKEGTLSRPERAGFQKALRTLNTVIFILVAFGPVTLVLFCLLVANAKMRISIHLVYVVPTSVGNLGVLFLTWLLTIKIFRRRRKRKSSSMMHATRTAPVESNSSDDGEGEDL